MTPICHALILCTNHYLPLGVRLAKKFDMYWRDPHVDLELTIATNQDPSQYMPKVSHTYLKATSGSWVEATNSKWDVLLTRIEQLTHHNRDYIFYFDADTDLKREVRFDDFGGELVAAQHFGDQSWMLHNKAFERNPKSSAYVPRDTTLPQMYFQGAFFGGKISEVKAMLKTLRLWKMMDQRWGYEPGVNDESYLNKYFHVFPPTRTLLTRQFPFVISDKGGIKNPRQMGQQFDSGGLLAHAQIPIAIEEGRVVPYVKYHTNKKTPQLNTEG